MLIYLNEIIVHIYLLVKNILINQDEFLEKLIHGF